MNATFAIERPRQPELLELLRLSDEFALSLYPPESCYMLDVSELEAANVTVFAARQGGVAVGIAALVDRGDGCAEVKRMFVVESARGTGVARALLAATERHATDRGIRILQLETGPKQPAAVALYESFGFAVIPNFGAYVGDEFSLCMEKRLR